MLEGVPEPPVLDAVEARVLGSLLEKELTVPQQYPLTLNALQAACNQASNREPVMGLGEQEIQDALDRLKGRGLVRFVYPSHGRSVTRYRQVVDELLGLEAKERALLAMLLLRGPQTVGELRLRTERMVAFDSTAAVEQALEALAGRPTPLVTRLARRPGQKEERYAELLSARNQDGAAASAEPAPATRPSNTVLTTSGSGTGDPGPLPSTRHDPDALAALRAEVAALQAELAALRDEFQAFRAQFEPDAPSSSGSGA
jgi:uncharacterized protein YceH (UPF0502 family)